MRSSNTISPEPEYGSAPEKDELEFDYPVPVFEPHVEFRCDARSIVITNADCIDDYVTDTAMNNKKSSCCSCLIGKTKRASFAGIPVEMAQVSRIHRRRKGKSDVLPARQLSALKYLSGSVDPIPQKDLVSGIHTTTLHSLRLKGMVVKSGTSSTGWFWKITPEGTASVT